MDRDADLMTKFASELHELKQTVHELVKKNRLQGRMKIMKRIAEASSGEAAWLPRMPRLVLMHR